MGKRCVLVRCPRCRSPRLVVTERGIALKCNSCKKDATGQKPVWEITWAKLEEIRAAICAGRPIEEQA